MNPFSVFTPAGATKIVFQGLEAMKSVVAGVFGRRAVQVETPSPPREIKREPVEVSTRTFVSVPQALPESPRASRTAAHQSNRNEPSGPTQPFNLDNPVGFDFRSEFPPPERRSDLGVALQARDKHILRARYGKAGPQLPDVFNDSLLMRSFRAHCENCFIAENLDFWRATQEFLKNPTVGNLMALKELIGEQINLSDKLRTNLENAVNHLTALCSHLNADMRLDFSKVLSQDSSDAINAASKHVKDTLSLPWIDFNKLLAN